MAADSATVGVFTRRLGALSETFVRRNIELLNDGRTVVVCRYLGEAPFDWIDESRVLVLSRFRRWTWGVRIACFCWKHRVRFAVVEFLDWACDMQPYLDFLRLPYLALGHGYDVSRYLRSRDGYSEKLSRLKSARAILLPSLFLKRMLLRGSGLEPRLICALPCGVNLERFAYSEYYRRNHLVFIGRFVEKKAPLLLLEAFRRAINRGAELTLEMGGEGPLIAEARAFVSQYALSDCVTFRGALGHDEVRERLGTAMAVVQHSVTAADGDTEGLPVVLQEALAVGAPVIATRHAGIPEIIDDRKHGFLVEERDVEGMAAAMCALAELSESAYHGMRRACRGQAEEKLSRSRRINWIDEQIREEWGNAGDFRKPPPGAV